MIPSGKQPVVNTPKVGRKMIRLDRYAIHPDAFRDGDQMRRAKEAGAVAVGAQDRFDERAGGALEL